MGNPDFQSNGRFPVQFYIHQNEADVLDDLACIQFGIYHKETMFEKLRIRMNMRRLVASDPRSHDIYIVEFPKSGITWLCTLLANMALSGAGEKSRATYYNVQHYVPDIHMAKCLSIGDSILPGIPQRLIKSHSEYNTFYQSVIYLARHPVPVMRSLCGYINQHSNRKITMDQLLADHKYGLPAWQRHVRGWLANHEQANRLHLVRYEDMISNADKVLKNISSNIGWEFSDEAIRNAVHNSSAEQMKRSEETYRTYNPRYSLEFVKRHTEEVREDMREKIQEICAKELQLLGYGNGE